MISRNTIDQIFQAADIRAVISDFIKLKKAGVNFTGLCPFHDEKTPSFIVSPAKGIYKCFGCGKGGNAVNFVMEHEHKTYPEALKYLADKFNITIEEDKKEPKDQKTEDLKEQLFLVNTLANNYFRSMPGFWEEINALAAETIQNRFTRDEVLQWQIGFVPDAWDGLLKHLKEKGVKEEFLIKSNLIKQSEKNHNLFDYFRGRIIFPILDTYGRPIAFGGRVVFPDKEGQKQPKYLNSPESVLYNKSQTLYGINFAKKAISEYDLCYLVEGYTDVISMHTAGLENTVAPCGTALTVGQIQFIKYSTKNLVLVYDGDNAGKNAILRNGQLAINEGMNVFVAIVPEGEDPDSLCKRLKEKTKEWILQNTLSFYEFEICRTIKAASIIKNKAYITCDYQLSVHDYMVLKNPVYEIILLSDQEDFLFHNAKYCLDHNINTSILLYNNQNIHQVFYESEEKLNAFCDKYKTDAILWFSSASFLEAKNDPTKKNEIIIYLTSLLKNFPKTRQNLYIDQISKENKIKPKLFTDELKELENIRIKDDDLEEWIPKGVNPHEFEKWGFYAYKNEYYFRTKNGNEKLSNFVMKPVFHIDSVYDSKRIYEMVNTYGHRVVVNLDMNEMTSLQAFQRNIESKGNFMFWGQLAQFQKLKLKLYEETRTCQIIENLGWQKEGFWAWANGFINPDTGAFEEIDEYGVISYDKQDYFIPAFSKIYIKDKTIFIDERKFRYMKNKIELKEWMKLFLEVHGENAMIGFAFYLAALFRDHIIYLNDNFPILNLYGQRGSGKNTMAYSLLALFGKRQNELNINNNTQAALAKYLEMNNNAIAFIDEYKNSLDFNKIETLKSIYNAIGRSRMNMDKGMKKETTQVTQAVILAGQEMPTVDPALSTRTIFLQFDKKENLKTEEKNKYELLQDIERNGLPHITVEFIKHRKYFVERYKENYEQVIKNITPQMKGEEVDDRLVRNMTSVCAAFKTLEPKFDFSFSYDDLIIKAIAVTRNHSRQIKQSDEIGIFWNLLEALFDENILIEGWHFKVRHQTEITLNTGNKISFFPDGKLVLEFKFNAIAKLYAEQLKRRGEKPLPQDSLKHYLSTNKHFIGIRKSSKFILKEFEKAELKTVERKQVTTSFCFDYKKLDINLEREQIESKEEVVFKPKIKPESEFEFEYNETPEIKEDNPF